MFNYIRSFFTSNKTISTDFTIEELAPYLTLFGSRLWGGATSKSDVDYITRDKNRVYITTFLDKKDIKYLVKTQLYEDVVLGITFNYKGFNYDISFCNETSYNYYLTAIPIIHKFSKMHKIKIKSKSYRRFIFVDLFEFLAYGTTCRLDLHTFLKQNNPELFL